MQGQKQITTFVVILIVIITFTFFRNAIRKDKEFKRIREEALRKKFETILEDNEAERYAEMDENASIDTKNYMYKFLEYKDICYDLHAIIFKPDQHKMLNQQSHLIVNGDNAKVLDSQKNDEHQDETAGQFLESKHQSSVITGPVTYLVIIILIYSFIKAATDMSRQLSKRNSGDVSGTRKCSLQEYAGSSKRNRRSSRAPVLKRATTVSVEPRLNIKQQSLEERRKSYLPELHTGTPLFVEPGTQPKAINGIGTRPPPLLRRCSVPAFALQSVHSSVLRRPSVDSHSEDDSSPDVKRRVRMIHRH